MSWLSPTGKWMYLYRAVDSTGQTIDFLPHLHEGRLWMRREVLEQPNDIFAKFWVVQTSRHPVSSMSIRMAATSEPFEIWKQKGCCQKRVNEGRANIWTTLWSKIIASSNEGWVQVLGSVLTRLPGGQYEATRWWTWLERGRLRELTKEKSKHRISSLPDCLA